MKRPFHNWLLTALAVVVLTLTISILLWLRGRTTQRLGEVVRTTVASFNAEALLGAPTTPTAKISAIEERVRIAKLSPFVRDLLVTKAVATYGEADQYSETEFPVAPWDRLALGGPGWLAGYAAYRREPLLAGGNVYGYLYFDLDRSELRSVDLAILAASIALFATLLTLVGRVFVQETKVVRLGDELTERRAELIRQGRLALAGQLSAGLLHDLKKPILKIRHNADDIKEALGDFGGASPALAELNDNVDLFFEMLNDTQMERFVRSGGVAEEYVDVNQVLEAALRLVHYERGSVHVERSLAENLPSIMAQPFRLVQVFSNLILNAYQAMNGQGTLRIETEPKDGGVEVRIADDGPGIPPDALPRIFEPFFTTKSEADGSGLGLAICRMIVQDDGGRIEAESPPGGPATFRVWLPAEKNNSARRV